MTESKTCTKCGETKPLSEFYGNSARASDGLNSQCKECKLASFAKRRHDRPFEASVNNARRRSVKTGVPFDLTEQYLESIWTGACPVFGTRMSLPNREKGNKLTPTRPSLDRLIPNKGYIPGNVIWVSFKANAIKSTATSADILAVGRWLQQIEEEIKKHETS